MRASVFLSFLALALSGCPDDEPQATGLLDRPAGLAVLARPAEPVDQAPLREDLLIVDSEAEGVKVLQYNGDNGNFVPAPVVFFPLVIPAPGFPTVIAASLQPPGGFTDRAYVLSSGSNQLHLIDVTPLGFGQSVLAKEGNDLIRTIDLDAIAAGLIPTDIAVLASDEAGDLVAVSFEGVAAEDMLQLLRIEESEDSQMVVATATIAAGPRGIGVRGAGTDDVRVLVSSSATSSITEVHVAGGTIVESRPIFAGGETGDVVDAGDDGAFAIRIDRPAVVHLVAGPTGRLVPASARSNSPFTPIDERDSTAVLDVHPSPIGAAAAGQIASLEDPGPRSTAEAVTGFSDPRIMGPRTIARPDGTELTALLLAHVDGTVSFVVTPFGDAMIATSVDATVGRITQTHTETASITVEVIDPSAGNTVVGACQTVDCAAPEALDPSCPGTLVRDGLPDYGIYRATYRGALARSQEFELTEVDTSSAGSRYQISDPEVESFADRRVELGDRVLTQVQSLDCANLEDPIDLIATGTVTEVDGAVIEVLFADLPPIVESCTGSSAPALSRRYEIHPPGETMVLSRVEGEQIVEVLDRVPVVSDGNGATAEFTGRLNMRIRSAGAFTCSQAAGVTACVEDADCGPGRTCMTMEGAALGCPATCTAVCDGMDPACIEELQARQCTTAELEVFPTIPMVRSAAQPLAGNEALPSAAPASAVFSTARKRWLISYPGSRAVVEFEPTAPSFIHIR